MDSRRPSLPLFAVSRFLPESRRVRSTLRFLFSVCIAGLVAVLSMDSFQLGRSDFEEVFLRQSLVEGQVADITVRAPMDVEISDSRGFEQRVADELAKARPVYRLNGSFASEQLRSLARSFEAGRQYLATWETTWNAQITATTREWQDFLTPLESQSVALAEIPTGDNTGEQHRESPAFTDSPHFANLRQFNATVPLPALPSVPIRQAVDPVPSFTQRYQMFLQASQLTLSEAQYEALEAQGFSEQVERTADSLFREMYEVGVVEDLSRESLRLVNGFLMQQGDTFRTANHEQVQGLYDLAKAEVSVRTALSTRTNLSAGERKVVKELLSLMVRPNLHFDPSATQSYRERIQRGEGIITPTITLKKGQILVSEGEPIRAHQIELFQVIRQRILVERESATSHGLFAAMPVLQRFAGRFLMAFLVLLSFYSYLRRYSKSFRQDYSTSVLLGVILVMNLVFVKGFLLLFQSLAESATLTPFDQTQSYLYAVPFSIGAMLTRILLGNKYALTYTTAFALMTFPMTQSPVALVLSLIGSLIAIYALEGYMGRGHVNAAGLLVGGVNIIIAFAINLTSNEVHTLNAAFEAGGGLIGGLLASVVVLFVLPLFEYLFGVTSNFRLMELMSGNERLLKDLSVKAPGTYAHSMAVANLAERACETIGANSVLARTGALYHDIGKMLRPQYFVENQMGEENPHDRLPPIESARIIREHVTAGAEMARQAKLPPSIIAFILTHHGTDIIRYFYVQACNTSGCGGENVDEKLFRYPGPKPKTREEGVMHLADAVEAATRALGTYTEEAIKNRVQQILTTKINEGQFNECELNLQELQTIYESFVQTLKITYHSRIEYPKMAARKTSNATIQPTPAAPTSTEAPASPATALTPAPTLSAPTSATHLPEPPPTPAPAPAAAGLSEKHPMAGLGLKLGNGSRKVKEHGNGNGHAASNGSSTNGNSAEPQHHPSSGPEAAPSTALTKPPAPAPSTLPAAKETLLLAPDFLEKSCQKAREEREAAERNPDSGVTEAPRAEELGLPETEQQPSP